MEEKIKKILGEVPLGKIIAKEGTIQLSQLFKSEMLSIIGENEVWETPLDFSGYDEKAQITGRNKLRIEQRSTLEEKYGK